MWVFLCGEDRDRGREVCEREVRTFYSCEFWNWGVSVEVEGISREVDIGLGVRFDCEEGWISFCVDYLVFDTAIKRPKSSGNGGLGSLDVVLGSVCGLVNWA